MGKDLTKMTLTELQGKKNSVAITQMGIGAVGTLAGFAFAYKKGKKFWGYVGFGFLGGVAGSSIAYFTTMQKINKINTEIAKRKGL